jgi:hypothetical protein
MYYWNIVTTPQERNPGNVKCWYCIFVRNHIVPADHRFLIICFAGESGNVWSVVTRRVGHGRPSLTHSAMKTTLNLQLIPSTDMDKDKDKDKGNNGGSSHGGSPANSTATPSAAAIRISRGPSHHASSNPLLISSASPQGHGSSNTSSGNTHGNNHGKGGSGGNASKADDSLSDFLCGETYPYYLIHACFFIRPNRMTNWTDKSRFINNFLFVLVVSWLSMCSLGFIAVSVQEMVLTSKHAKLLSLIMGLNVTSAIFMLVSSGYSMYAHSKRLLLAPDVQEYPYYTNAARKCLAFMGLFLLLMFLGVTFLYSPDMTPFSAFGMFVIIPSAQWLMLSGITLSLFFSIVDAKTSRAMISELITEVQQQALTVDRVEEIRALVSERVKYSSRVTSVIAFIAFYNGFILILSLICIRLALDHPSYYSTNDISFSAGEVLVATAYLLKEVVYLGFLVVEIANVNDLADKLMKVVATKCWIGGFGSAASPHHHPQHQPLTGTDSAKELDRLRVFVSLFGEPLAYTLCGTRPSRAFVIYGFGGYALSIAIGYIQLVFSNQIEQVVGSTD